jgi:anti-sigma factor (TIGR02949 family)
MTQCEDIATHLQLYLDDELQGDERSKVQAHLQNCEACRFSFDREREFLNAVRKAGQSHEASPELRTRVNEILSDSKPVNSLRRPRRASSPSLTWGFAAAAAFLVLVLPLIIWRLGRVGEKTTLGQPSSFALMAADTHLRHMRGQLPLEIESVTPQHISEWFANKVNFSVQLPNYQESSGQEILYSLEGARLVGYKDDYAAYVAYRMKTRPISLVITSDAVAHPSGGEEITARGLRFHYNAIQGLKVITWSDRGLTYALVSDLAERGQESCIVCHQGTKDRDLIAPLKPK